MSPVESIPDAAVGAARPGARRKAAHVIAQIKYSPLGPSSSECSCGETFQAATPNELEALWHDHRAPDRRRTPFRRAAAEVAS